MIDVKNVNLSIGKKKILKDANLCLHPGDIYGLLGPNRAGKSTIIFALLGLFAHTKGQIRVLGRDPNLGDLTNKPTDTPIP
ncbi:ATP-binding cassette domain-containing protein [Desulfobacula sp.]